MVISFSSIFSQHQQPDRIPAVLWQSGWGSSSSLFPFKFKPIILDLSTGDEITKEEDWTAFSKGGTWLAVKR